MTNELIAQRLSDYARQMDQDGGLFRARAYRAAAFAILRLHRPLREILVEGGRKALEAIPGIGISMAYTIDKLLTTGEFCILREPDQSQRMIAALPGVGPRLAEILRDHLHVKSLDDLLQVAREGRLSRYVGRERLRGIVNAAEARLELERNPLTIDEPSVEDLLAVEASFRQRGESSARLNGWTLRCSLANTALAHRLGRIEDWVVIEFQRDEVNGRRTVVTETRGDQTGQRVVRGREAECRSRSHESSAA